MEVSTAAVRVMHLHPNLLCLNPPPVQNAVVRADLAVAFLDGTLYQARCFRVATSIDLAHVAVLSVDILTVRCWRATDELELLKYVAPPKLTMEPWQIGVLRRASNEIGPNVSPPSFDTATPRPRGCSCGLRRMCNRTEPFGSCVSALSSMVAKV